MIYLQNIHTPQAVFIPRNYSMRNAALTLELMPALGSGAIRIEVIPTNTYTMYESFDVTLPENIKDGEYVYSLISDQGVTLSNGVLMIGDFCRKVKANKIERKYKQYGE